MPWALGDLQAWPIPGCPVPLQPGTGPCVLAQSLDTELKQQDDAMDGTWPSGNARVWKHVEPGDRLTSLKSSGPAPLTIEQQRIREEIGAQLTVSGMLPRKEVGSPWCFRLQPGREMQIGWVSR